MLNDFKISDEIFDPDENYQGDLKECVTELIQGDYVVWVFSHILQINVDLHLFRIVIDRKMKVLRLDQIFPDNEIIKMQQKQIKITDLRFLQPIP